MLRIVIFLLAFYSIQALSDDTPAGPDIFDQASKLDKPKPVDFSKIDVELAKKQIQKAFSELENKPALPSLPKLDLLSIQAPEVDIDNLVKQGNQIRSMAVDKQESRYKSQILVFISSSMPEKTIANYLRQTANIDAAVVFRGFKNNSLMEMKKYLSIFLDPNGRYANIVTQEPNILIDPTLFDRFDIQQVPVTLVTESEIKPCQTKPCPTPVYHTVSGDVSLPWALSLVSRQIDSDALKGHLRPLIKDLEQSNGS